MCPGLALFRRSQWLCIPQIGVGAVIETADLMPRISHSLRSSSSGERFGFGVDDSSELEHGQGMSEGQGKQEGVFAQYLSTLDDEASRYAWYISTTGCVTVPTWTWTWTRVHLYVRQGPHVQPWPCTSARLPVRRCRRQQQLSHLPWPHWPHRGSVELQPELFCRLPPALHPGAHRGGRGRGRRIRGWCSLWHKVLGLVGLLASP